MKSDGWKATHAPSRATHVLSRATHSPARGGCRWRKEPRLEARGFLATARVPSRVDQGTTHLMVGLTAGVEVVVGKVHRKNFPTTARCSNGGGRFQSFM